MDLVVNKNLAICCVRRRSAVRSHLRNNELWLYEGFDLVVSALAFQKHDQRLGRVPGSWGKPQSHNWDEVRSLHAGKPGPTLSYENGAASTLRWIPLKLLHWPKLCRKLFCSHCVGSLETYPAGS